MTAAPPRLRVLVAVTGSFHGNLRLRRSSGTLDSEGVDKILSPESLQALSLAKQLQAQGAELVAVHVDKGDGEDVLREALAHGADQGILVAGTEERESDAAMRAHAVAEVYRQNGPFDAVIGPPHSEFAGFTGTLASVAGLLELPCVVGVRTIARDGDGFRIAYQSLFGDYDLKIPRPCVVLAGDLGPSHPTAWGIHDAYQVRGLLRVQTDAAALPTLTKRLRIEPMPRDSRTLEQVDGNTLVRRMRSRGLIPDKSARGRA